jgi:SAM-dependent methyltransferase
MDSRDNWDQHWDRYAETAERNPAQLMRHALIAKIIKRSDRLRTQSILDIGSGQGDLLVKLSKEYPEAILMGFELSAKGVEISRRKLPQASFYEVDLFNIKSDVLRFEHWATDAVCSEVLEHLDSPEMFLRQLRSYLKTDARLVVTVPGGPMSAFDRHIGHRQHFTPESITRVLESAEFEVEKIYRCGFPFFNLYRLTVILRGERLTRDVDHSRAPAGASRLANFTMAVFRGLFQLNLLNFPWGWQVVAIARKK